MGRALTRLHQGNVPIFAVSKAAIYEFTEGKPTALGNAFDDF
jgi:hypothetical protein